MKERFTDTYWNQIEKNQVLYDEQRFSGIAIQEWHKNLVIKCLAKWFAPTEWLDYGCGPATSYQQDKTMWKLARETHSGFTLYDPCNQYYNNLDTSRSYPGVICVDVLEHIPESDIPNTLDLLFELCTEWMFLFISTKRDSATFPDGTNTHCTLKTRTEWANIIEQYASKTDIPVVLGTDYQGTFDHYGKYFTYDDWNMPSTLQEQIKLRYKEVDQNNQVQKDNQWNISESVFR
jgi:hypothetical protein